MTIQNFIEILAPAFMESGCLLTPETRYKELSDWSSLAALMVITTIGQQCGVSLESTDIIETETIQELFDIVSSKQ